MRRKSKATIKYVCCGAGVLCFILLLVKSFSYEDLRVPNFPKNYFLEPDKLLQFNEPFFNGKLRNSLGLKKDWHDYEFMEYEKSRKGFGENGEPEKLSPEELPFHDELFYQNGYNALLSDKIALNRSVPDIRHKDCAKKKYLAELPTVSIVIPFFNEHLSTLLRTVYSVVNRSPKSLLKEVILVDDFSDKVFLNGQLDDYVKEFLPSVKIIHMPERVGLIVARSEGARAATGDVLIFLDSHSEANVNWLPPLLEPIAENYKVCVCPFIDVIAFDSYQYRAQDEGARGVFDWKFLYRRLPLLPEDLKKPTEPFASPVMAGGLFAISAKFFWELGGYDEGLDIWGGEQYELSFKIWQCGGAMYDAPCSRVGHIYRGSTPFPNVRKTDFVTKNFKRVAEVWMDEYKEYLYMRYPERYNNSDPGDLTKQKAIREKLQCKSFKWFMETVAFDIVSKYPLIDPPDFAWGTIKSKANNNLCVDALNHQKMKPAGLYPCAKNLTYPQGNQFYALSHYRDIRMKLGDACLDAAMEPKKEVILYGCHMSQGNQYWKYDMENNLITHGRDGKYCLQADPFEMKLFVDKCNLTNINQKWEFGAVNLTMMNNWDKLGAAIL